MLIFLYKLNVLIFKGQQKQNSKGQQSFDLLTSNPYIEYSCSC